ncbi:PadR family transcriptional regulator [Nonomuraea sp. NN258]|uniref:PadR family transcriptional regulator n=1 Tax=Nonomuraea antri TaxID=2730852 RepID=UPI001569634F|nr:helix-turn-helix transcriptional regulator [Nonomuraea antri]NRQ37348.1 PadR family transcriptional regulator [Nonomuraea antri]
MKLDTVRGHLDAMVLAVLEPGPLHGYAIISTLRSRGGGSLDLPSGTIYPALRRLERADYVAGAWSVVGGRKRRTYELTQAGRRALANERDTWKRFGDIVEVVLGSD